VELAELQDQEVGDGTTSVVIVAAELLKRANELVRNKIHPTSIIIGYRLAMREVRGLLACNIWPIPGLVRPYYYALAKCLSEATLCQCRHASTSQRRWR